MKNARLIICLLVAAIPTVSHAAALTALWDFNGTYVTTNDNHSYDLIPGGSVTLVPSPRGQAALFHFGAYVDPDPAMDRVDTVAQPTNVSLNSSLSIMGWIKPGTNNQPGIESAIITHDRSGYSMNDFGFRLQVNTDYLQLRLMDNQDNRLVASTLVDSIQPEQWIHIGATWDGSTSGGIVLYINGEPASISLDRLGSFQGLNGTNPLPFRIGASHANSLRDVAAFDGSIDQLSLWQGVLTPAEVLANFNTSIPEPASLLLLGLGGLLIRKR